MIITNVNIITPLRIIENSDLRITDGIISEIGYLKPCEAEQVIDGGGLYLAPGFIDIHLHGGGGFDFMNANILENEKICRMHASHGTCAMYPTSLSSSREDLNAFIQAYIKTLEIKNLPDLLGIHLEGPYFSQGQKGAQDEKYIIPPDYNEYSEIIEYGGGHIKRWSIAPEVKGAFSMAAYLRKKGIVVSAAHTDAGYCDMLEAVENGVSLLTHFYSCMTGVHRKNAYRHAGVIEAGYGIDELNVEIIADGRHLPPELLKLILKLKGSDKTVLVTDASMGAGMPDGEYILGNEKNGQKIIVENEVAFVADKTAFAGSIATADKLVRNMVRLSDASLCDAVKMMTLTPARIMGISHFLGSITVGKRANLVLFDEDININMSIAGGNIIYERGNEK